MKWAVAAAVLTLFARTSTSWPYDPALTKYNLNENQHAASPLDYSGQWPNHTYHPSPSTWRVPFYSLFLDRFVNGDPTNDNINGSVWEHNIDSNQMRHGGDIVGLVDTLDYLQGMGIKVRAAISQGRERLLTGSTCHTGSLYSRNHSHEPAVGVRRIFSA
jgi:alpha-1,3-glucan synthase